MFPIGSPLLPPSGGHAPAGDATDHPSRFLMFRGLDLSMKPAGAQLEATRCMTLGPQRTRLVLGVYERLGDLCAPIAALKLIGVAPDQLGLIAMHTTVALATRPELTAIGDWQHVSAMLSETVPLIPGPGDGGLMATRRITGLLRDGLVRSWWINTPLAMPHAGGVGDPDIQAHLRQGRAVLAIATASREQQWQSTRLLLSSSQYPVETREFKPQT